jgi:flavin reductase (DIM6/NTAB) family NADH-FMN oxidoreductase RutF
LYGISLAPKRYSASLIKTTQEFVINFIPYSLVEAAHYCGTHSGKKIDKVCKTGLTLIPSKKVSTPMIQEGYAHLECKLRQSISLGDHLFFIGEVVAVSSDENAFEHELLRTDTMHPVYYIGENAYTTLDRTKRKTF